MPFTGRLHRQNTHFVRLDHCGGKLIHRTTAGAFQQSGIIEAARHPQFQPTPSQHLTKRGRQAECSPCRSGQYGYRYDEETEVRQETRGCFEIGSDNVA
jgi:hypothetical protein